MNVRLKSVEVDTRRFGLPTADISERMANRLPLLVTGIAGVPGFNAFHFFRSRFPGLVKGERREDQWPLSGPDILGCNLDDPAGLDRLFAEYNFQSVLSCGGSCKLKSCELDPQRAERVNVSTVANILRVLRGSRVRLVHTSIDLVFSGKGKGRYKESDSPDPVTVYGKTMTRAEEMILEQRPESCIVRISLPMGVSFNGHAGAIDWIQSRFKQDKPATLYFDEVRTPTYTDCLSALYEKLLLNDLNGLFHAGGPRQLSLFEIAQIVNVVGGYRPELLHGCPRAEAGPMPPRAGNVTLDSSKLTEALGECPFDPWPLHDQLVPTDRQWHHRRSKEPEGSLDRIEKLLYQNPNRNGAQP